ncbi:hypothetical protein KEF29_29610 [Streptomyces tuirus]|uniref:Uncharacterized protein n=1 Tax=Streptomyces tuirus TaxID=68278 RepID=A0A941FL09_9ACTN|nr:hypothetical protein [Streptomyces tuirus]
MRSATSEPMQALLARFREIVEAEEGRCRAADLAVEEIEAALRRARDAQRVAAERRAEAAAAYETAAAYATGQDRQTQGPTQGGAGTEGDAPFGEGAPSGRAVQHLIVDVLEVGQITPLAEIYDGVRRLRPGTTNSAIRSALSGLHKTGSVEIIRRSVYRLLKTPEDYQPQS